MPDVSRAEYDAALTRVRKLRCDGGVCVQVPDCSCVQSTLAALGLDEPPTEENAVTPEPAPEIVMDANGHYWRRYDDSLSMTPTTTANEPTEIVAVYRLVRDAASSPLDVSWRGEQPTIDDLSRSVAAAATCSRCGAPQRLSALGEWCNQNCGGRSSCTRTFQSARPTTTKEHDE